MAPAVYRTPAGGKETQRGLVGDSVLQRWAVEMWRARRQVDVSQGSRHSLHELCWVSWGTAKLTSPLLPVLSNDGSCPHTCMHTGLSAAGATPAPESHNSMVAVNAAPADAMCPLSPRFAVPSLATTADATGTITGRMTAAIFLGRLQHECGMLVPSQCTEALEGWT